MVNRQAWSRDSAADQSTVPPDVWSEDGFMRKGRLPKNNKGKGAECNDIRQA
jgi:hypothetical protein